MNAFRVCNRWERLQNELFGEFNEFDITEYKKVIDAITDKGSIAIIDPHNYARYKDELIGSENVPIDAFVDFWTRLAELFKDNEKVWFGLVNEPHDMETEDWFKIARAAVDGIRSTGAKNNILIPGNGWTGAWSWGKEAWYGDANADIALKYFSSEDENILFEVHQYFDEDKSGTHEECVQRPCQNLFKDFVEWLKTNNLKGWIGEIGSFLNDECKECVQEAIEYLQENNEYIVGVQWWAAGPWWGQNAMSIEPNAEKAFPGQMAWLKPYLPGPSELTEVPTFINKKVYCEGCIVTGTGGDGSLWGWEHEKACEIDKETCGYNSGKPIDDGKVYCKGCVVTATGDDGSLWGWEDEKSCIVDEKICKDGEEKPSENNDNNEDDGKIYCKGCVVTATGGDNSLWGWEDQKSCQINEKKCKNKEENPSENNDDNEDDGKIYCKGCVVTATGGNNSLWGWENQKSCQINEKKCKNKEENPSENNEDEGINYCKGCVVTATGDNGSLWGWEDQKSCQINEKKCKSEEEKPSGNNNGDGESKKLQYFGVNESSAEFGENNLPGKYNKHYTYPDITAIETTMEQGMNAFRVCNRWERLQNELFGEFNEFDITEYKKVIDAITDKGSIAIIDPHNYARYKDELIGSENVPIDAFVDFWTRLAELFKDNEKVWFGLVNEPHDMETEDWFKIARAAVDGIRSTGAKNNILIPGNGWTGAWSWGKEAWYGDANADIALKYFSSEDENILFEVHQYFDEDKSGTHEECVQRPCQNLFKDFVEWLKTNNLKGWIGEIGSFLNDECKECVQEAIEYLQENNEYIVGVQWWAAGPWWGQNAMSIEPNAEKAFPGQMAWLKPYLPGPSELTEVPTFINKKVYCEGCIVTGTGGDGSLWGWEHEKACEIDKETCGYNSGKPIDDGKVYCKGCVVTATGDDGSLWGWEDEKSCIVDEKICSEDTPNTPEEEDDCWAEHLGYKCCSHCVTIMEDQDGAWGAENGEWCGITNKCSSQIEQCWSAKFGYPCCEDCNVILEDESGKWGALNGEWCGVPTSCEA